MGGGEEVDLGRWGSGGGGPADDEDGAACLGASVVFHVASSPRQLLLAILHLGWLFMRCRI